jgi:hypothetical protein
MATPSLSLNRVVQRIREHRQAVMVLARLAAKKAVQGELRAQGVRVSLVPHAEVMRRAREYLDTHPGLYQQALERANRLRYVEPRLTKINNSAQTREQPKSITSAVHNS